MEPGQMYPVHTAPGVFVDHEALHNLVVACSRSDARVVLVGFGEYAKHLINLQGNHIVAVYDPNPLYAGREMHFRGVPIINDARKFDANLIVCCEYKYLYEYFGQVVRLYDWMEYYYPPRLHYKDTSEIKVWEQESLYQSILKNEEDAPVSMMVKEKIRFLVELLRAGMQLHPTAAVLEQGSWQGGSSWFIGKALRFLRQGRTFYMMDLFETHSMDPTATMCTDEIRARMAEVYDHAVMITGLVDDPACLAQIKGPLCFAHIDLGFQEEGLRFAWDNLLPGAPLLLDNYGHLGAPPWRFDDFFAARGTRVIRFPWSEQGLVIKT